MERRGDGWASEVEVDKGRCFYIQSAVLAMKINRAPSGRVALDGLLLHARALREPREKSRACYGFRTTLMQPSSLSRNVL
jgi:hypothetical protein